MIEHNLMDPAFSNSLHELSVSFPEEKSWCLSMKQFGKIDSTCLEISFNDDFVVEEILLRIDLRCISEFELQKICDFAHANFLKVEFQGSLCDATIKNFMNILKKSNASRFIRNPEGYFREISNI